MIESVKFRNFKALRNTTLPLGRFTLVVGPNGSGKSTALQALQALGDPSRTDFSRTVTAGPTAEVKEPIIEVIVRWGNPYPGTTTTVRWTPSGADGPRHVQNGRTAPLEKLLQTTLRGVRIYSFDAQAIAAPAHVEPNAQLGFNGANLASVLVSLMGADRERFDRLNDEMGRWMPEFDRVLFETPDVGRMSLLMRRRDGRHQIQASELSQGTLLALAILTVAYLPVPPAVVCLEEPDRGIHPRLLRDVRDAMYRLSYPESFGEERAPVQVIATTHSPYLLDLYRDHPEEVVIADKLGLDVRFERLSDREDLDEILGDVQLGDAWYSGVLGGVPTHP